MYVCSNSILLFFSSLGSCDRFYDIDSEYQSIRFPNQSPRKESIPWNQQQGVTSSHPRTFDDLKGVPSNNNSINSNRQIESPLNNRNSQQSNKTDVRDSTFWNDAHKNDESRGNGFAPTNGFNLQDVSSLRAVLNQRSAAINAAQKKFNRRSNYGRSESVEIPNVPPPPPMSGPDIYKGSTKTYGSCDDLLNAASEKFVSNSSTHDDNTRKFGATQLKNNNLLNQGHYDVAPMEQAERQELRRISLELVKPGKGKLPPPLPRKVSMADILNRSSPDDSNEYRSNLIMPPPPPMMLHHSVSSPLISPLPPFPDAPIDYTSSHGGMQSPLPPPPPNVSAFGFPTSPKLHICPPPPSLVPGVHLGSKIHQPSDFSNNSAPPPPPPMDKHSLKKSNFPNTSINQALPPPPPPLFHSSATHNPPPPPLHNSAHPPSLPAFPISPPPPPVFPATPRRPSSSLQSNYSDNSSSFYDSSAAKYTVPPPPPMVLPPPPPPGSFSGQLSMPSIPPPPPFPGSLVVPPPPTFPNSSFPSPPLSSFASPNLNSNNIRRNSKPPVVKENDPQTELFAAILKRRSGMENE